MELLSARLSELMRAERWTQAVALVEAHREDAYDNFELSWNAGWALVRLGRYRDAIRYFERSTALDHDHAAYRSLAWWGVGVTLMELGDRKLTGAEFERAEGALLRSIELRPGHNNRRTLALLYQMSGRHDEAERVHVESLAERRSRERLLDYAAFLGDTGRAAEDAAITAEAELTASERRRRSP